MSGFLHHLRVCNAHDPADYCPWSIGDAEVGLVPHAIAEKLQECGFTRSEAGLALPTGTFEELSEKLAEASETLREAGLAAKARGEFYPVLTHPDADPLAILDRGAATEFGIVNKGFHLNGIVRRVAGTFMWIARRARDKATYPGKLDNMVAGGHPAGISAFDNLLKECAEEAGIPAEIAATARPTGVISYRMAVQAGLRRHMFYTYDLELDPDFVPQAVDGEVESFELLPIGEVMRIVETEPDAFKYNCNLAIIDYLLRNGFIAPDHPDYFELANGLRLPKV
jgi:isopentenyldiphosphate isomerase